MSECVLLFKTSVLNVCFIDRLRNNKDKEGTSEFLFNARLYKMIFYNRETVVILAIFKIFYSHFLI